jgi:aspartyl-tRNA(Asn)/glutamyl-tRNA(Gln) amidotransferase subunit C
MAISEKEVRHVALLARLAVTDEEVQKFTQQLDDILEHAGKISSVNVDNVPPTSHAIPLRNVFREDVSGECVSPEKALLNAPKQEDQSFMVPKIV